ncbi:MAG: ATP-binding protein [Candidatus Zixiibacteriota bacterium]|nr:MAG: ATP-binding protein [candidate division Zixibacteria bacterium]
MNYKYFKLNCIFRIVLLAISIWLFVYLIMRTELYASIFIVGFMVVIQAAMLIKYIERTNRDLARFLGSIKYSDFSATFSGGGKSSFGELNEAFNDVVSEFRNARAEKEEQYHYLQTIVQHVGHGLLAYDADGKVDLINNAAKRLLNIPHLKNIKELSPKYRPLVDALLKIGSGEKELVKIETEHEFMQLAVFATGIKLRDKAVILVSIQNIESELSEQELESWQKIIRVLNHEIMNSVTPITSIASTINDLIKESAMSVDDGFISLSAESSEDVKNALATIEKRGKGLVKFINSYRNLSNIPKPEFQVFPVSELFERVSLLLRDRLEKQNIDFRRSIEPESLELTADKELLEQALINLVLNAADAVNENNNAKIELKSQLDEKGRVLIAVEDNGSGIDQDALDKIFTPFYTTKKEGAGIGLSFTRQVMRLHKGKISVKSEPEKMTQFTLLF